MKPPRWITSVSACLEAQRYGDWYDREVLKIEPLGKLASQATREERRAYQARRDEAFKKLHGRIPRYKGTSNDARERTRKANIARAEKGRAGEMEVSDADSLSGAG